MFWIIKKELLYELRYKITTLNIYLSGFFMIFPYVLAADTYGIASRILMNMIIWSWMCQFLFGIGNIIEEEKVTGTFINVIFFPISITKYYFFRYLFLVIDCSIMTLITLFLFYLCGYHIENISSFVFTLLLESISLFSFSVFYSSILMRFKRLRNINAVMHQFFGALSGYTVSINKYPYYIRFVSYLLPLTYSIIINENGLFNQPIFYIAMVGLSIIYLILGMSIMRIELRKWRREGAIEQW